MNYRTDLDAIKGLAIIAVVFYHMKFLTSGYLGVDAFFVINGFFIFPAILRLIEGDNINGLFSFWGKRILRLWPLTLISTFFCLLVGFGGMLPDDFENLSESVIATNLFSENVLSAITTKNYWDVSNDYKPLMHMWYVGVLIEFYIATPLILWCICKFTSRKNNKFPNLCKNSIVALALLSFLFYLSPLSEGAGRFYYLPSRFWEIALGGITALLINKYKLKSFFNCVCANSVFTFLFLLIICIGLICPNYNSVFALVLCTFVTAYLLVANSTKNIFCRMLSWRPLCMIGKMSFSIFVWHQIFLAFYRYFKTDELSPLFVFCFWAVTLLVSWLSYTLIEQKVKVSKLSFATSVFFMIFLLIPSVAIYVHAGVVRDVPEMNIYFDKVHRGMHAEYVDRVYKMDCDFGNDSAKHKVLVVGDSFARDWVNVLLESNYKDSLDISYAYSFEERLIPRILVCDYLFIRTKKTKVPQYVWDNINLSKVWGIGTKTFGSNNGIIYSHRNDPHYFSIVITPKQEFLDEREQEIEWWGRHYVDMMTPVSTVDGKIKVFTPNHKFISQDCTHLTEDGAKYYASVMDLCYIFAGDFK